MTEPRHIANELQYSISGPAWHGPALSELLADIDSEQANARPLPDAHTIHEMVLHLISWQNAASGALRGEPMPELPFPEDWPSTDGREWESTLKQLLTASATLVTATNGLSDEDLGKTVPGRDHSVYYLLHGIAQHNAYHGGQIALLKKALQPRTS